MKSFPKKPRTKSQGRASLSPAGRSENSSLNLHPSSLEDVPHPSSLLKFRPYQLEAFQDKTSGILILLWARQTGKSFTLAAWAVDRLISNPGRTVTVLSNSKVNGVELNRKCAEICELLGHAFEQLDLSPDNRFESFNTETRIPIGGKVGRIKVLAANPRTARGLSGDLILDEFAFHEDSSGIWEAAHPILDAHQDYLCRIASTPNGKHNMFYRLATDPAIPRLRVTRTLAYAQGCPVFHPVTRQPITPAEARALARNKRAYDQNFECAFEDENMALLTHELISAAERPDVGIICEQNWSEQCLSNLRGSRGDEAQFNSPFTDVKTLNDSGSNGRAGLSSAGRSPSEQQSEICNFKSQMDSSFHLPPSSFLYGGVDVGRHRDRTVITVVEKLGATYLVRAILRLEAMRFPEQQQRLEQILGLPNIRTIKMDVTGIGWGLFEYTRQKFPGKLVGIDFSTTMPASALGPSLIGAAAFPSIRVTEYLATRLLQTYEDRAIQHPIDAMLREDLRKPERLVGPTGRVSIAATRDGAGHADHFWSLALAIDAAKAIGQPATFVKVIPRWKRPLFNTRHRGLNF